MSALSARHRRELAGWAFIMPNLVGVMLFLLVPVVVGAGLSFANWNLVSGVEGVRLTGLENYRLLAVDPAYWRAVGRTVQYAGIAVPVTVASGLLLALALHAGAFGSRVLQLIFFLPHVVSMIALGVAWLLILHPTAGIVNLALKAVGMDSPPLWLASPQWALWCLMAISIWAAAGFHALVFMAALQAVPKELQEAAMIDGAGWFRRFTTVTWPAITPTVTFLVVTSIIGFSQGFGLIAFLTEGGPGEASTTLSYLMYQTGFQQYRFGSAAAMGMTAFIGVAVVTALYWRWQRGRSLA